jgi:hypothetical protein
MKWAEHIACMEEILNECQTACKTQEWIGRQYENVFKEIGWKGMDWINLAHR